MFGSRNILCLSVVRFGLVFAALSTWLLVPTIFAQSSSSADYNQEMASLIQNSQPTLGQQSQYPNEGGYSRQGYNPRHSEDVMSHIAVEAGGGFNRPTGYTRNFATWGGNLEFGAGWTFSKWFTTLAEYEFFSNKIPGGYLANVGVPGGHIHTWGLTLEPTVYYKTSGTLGGYVLGGGGFYRRVTTFTVPQLEEGCSYFYCEEFYVNVPVAHYSSNQGGFNVGTGVTWKAFGEDSHARLFGEVRYVWVNSPAQNVFATPDGKEGFVPVTVGLRW